MARAFKSVDVRDVVDVVGLAREVHESGELRVLRDGDEDLVILLPVEPPVSFPWRKKTEADYEAFRSAAGSWSDIDTDALVEDIYADRRIDDRPAIEL